MKEIKFRFWMRWKHNNDQGWMEYFKLDPVKLPKLVHTAPKKTINNFPHYFRNHVAERYGEEQLDYAIMQYIGLKDIKGKDIYEGDICKIDTKNGRMITNIELSHIFEGVGYREAKNDKPMNLEIIGNIHQSPDLIKRIK